MKPLDHKAKLPDVIRAVNALIENQMHIEARLQLNEDTVLDQNTTLVALLEMAGMTPETVVLDS